MRAVEMNRLVIVVAVSAAFVMCSQRGAAGTLRIVHSIDFPFAGRTVNDIAWDGQHLLTAVPLVSLGGTIYAVDPADGSVVRQLTAVPAYIASYRGLGWDGSYLWATAQMSALAPAEQVEDVIEKIDAHAMPGPVSSVYEAPHSPDAGQHGAAWDGAYLWVSDANHQEIMQLDPTDMTVLRSFSSPGPMPLGLAWGRSSLWCVDGAERSIYQLDSSGKLMETWSVPLTAPSGLTFDGNHLWVTDNDTRKIYHVATPEPSSLVMLAVITFTLFCLGWARQRGPRNRSGRCLSE